MADLSPIDRLIIIEEIKRMRASFARLLDTKDWAGFRRLWTDDAHMTINQAAGTEPTKVSGGDAIVALIRGSLDPAVSVHHPLAPEITVLSPAEARGIWAMEDRLMFPSGRSVHGFGHYNEDYVKVGGEWRVKTFNLTRIHVMQISA